MKRTLKDYLFIGFKGMAMGAADVVPGVSGGTIAFISGIYEELLNSISNINLGLFKTLRKEGFAKAWKQLNGNFLASLFLGIIISVVSLAKAIKWLLENEPILLWSFFFGLVLASIIYIAKQITNWNAISFVLLILGALLAYWITTLNPLISENSSPLFLFLAGAIAICAMILPGISGSFILVLLGAYKPILEAVNNRDLKTIALVGAGAIVGLLAFSKVLKWLFNNYKNYTLVALTGFILGSLNKIWPWKKVLTFRTNSHGEQVPFNEQSVLPTSFDGDSKLLMAIVLMLVGFAFILLLEKLAVENNQIIDSNENNPKRNLDNENAKNENNPNSEIISALGILNLKVDSNSREIKIAYRNLAKKYNTDQRENLEPHIKNMLLEKMKELNKAMEVLKNNNYI